ncbi:substrate-binding domain-containing protein, partial [Phascolarctobacterium faecium]
PFLTTFDINIQELAKESVQSLMGLLKSTKNKSQKVIIPFKLIERESVLTHS